MKKDLLPLVEKPSRYLGGESGVPQKDPASVRLRLCLAFPDVYEIGMSHLGHHILYSVLNGRNDVLVDRVYAPWPDAMDLLVQKGEPLCGIETKVPLKKFDAVGFTLAYELGYTNVLAMLDLADIPLRSIERSDDDPIVLAGGPCAMNPAPMSLFIDAFALGDGEETILELAQALIDCRDRPRKERLERLAALEGVFVPSLSIATASSDAPVRPRRRILPDMNTMEHPEIFLSPNSRLIHERLAVEVARGCTRGCRFCQAGYLYRPVRERTPQNVAQRIEKGLAATGFDEVSLLSLSPGVAKRCLPAGVAAK